MITLGVIVCDSMCMCGCVSQSHIDTTYAEHGFFGAAKNVELKFIYKYFDIFLTEKMKITSNTNRIKIRRKLRAKMREFLRGII